MLDIPDSSEVEKIKSQRGEEVWEKTRNKDEILCPEANVEAQLLL